MFSLEPVGGIHGPPRFVALWDQVVFLAFRPLALSNKSRGEGAKNSNFNELLLQTIRLCLCCQEEETLGTSTPALGFLTRQILALSLFALLLHLVFSFSPPPSLFCVSSLQMWLREPLPWQSTQRNLLLWVILRWTSSYTSGRDQTHVPTEPRAQEHLVAIILSPPPLCPTPATPTPSCTHRFYSTVADGAFWRFGTRGWGRLFSDGVTCRPNVRRIRRSERLSSSPPRRRSKKNSLRSTAQSLCRLPTRSFIYLAGRLHAARTLPQRALHKEGEGGGGTGGRRETQNSKALFTQRWYFLEPTIFETAFK